MPGGVLVLARSRGWAPVSRPSGAFCCQLAGPAPTVMFLFTWQRKASPTPRLRLSRMGACYSHTWQKVERRKSLAVFISLGREEQLGPHLTCAKAVLWFIDTVVAQPGVGALQGSITQATLLGPAQWRVQPGWLCPFPLSIPVGRSGIRPVATDPAQGEGDLDQSLGCPQASEVPGMAGQQVPTESPESCSATHFLTFASSSCWPDL